MPTAAWCSGCKTNVWVSPDGGCPNGHPRSSLRGLYEVTSEPGAKPEYAAAASPVKAFATTVNARQTGSRFLGECEINVASGVVTITGHRLPQSWVLLRTLANVAFIPSLLAVFVFIIMWATGSSASLLLAAVFVVAFALCIGTLIYTDVWSPTHAEVESADWHVGAARDAKRVKDATAGIGAPAPSMLIRALNGKNVLRLRVPVGPARAFRTLALRPSPEFLSQLETMLTATA